jgi:hypothetical protein
MDKTKKKIKRKTRNIVTGHLEKVNSKIFDRYQKQITELIRGNLGVYALYRRENLYYIGLARDFKNRIKHHLKDRHQGKWDRFSLYIIRKEDHLRELESLLIRIGDPAGNYQRGRLKRSKNLLPGLERQVKEQIKNEMDGLFRPQKSAKKRAVKMQKGKRPGGKVERPLKGVFTGGKMIYATYKGKDYKAWVRPNGSIRYDGQEYTTPSGAGKAVTGKSVDGWFFWKYKDKAGKLVKISDLRK